MNELMILAQTGVNEQDVVTPFEQNLLVILVFVIMFGLGAGLTPKDFRLAFRRPWGLIIGWITQFGLMPLITVGLIVTLLFQLPLEYAAPVALGALLMGSVPAGTTSNIFTYFSKGNLALSVMMTTHSTLWAILMTPLILALYGNWLFADQREFEIPLLNIVVTLVLLLVPVVAGMWIRKKSANVGAVLELLGGFVGLFFIVFLIAYVIARAIRLHPMNARTIALETGIQNGPLGIAIVLLSFSGNSDIGLILIIPALYSLFIVLVATFVTFWFRRANLAEEQKIPNLL